MVRILNLYVGIGGNRKLWGEVVDDLEVTAIEIEEEIAKIYQDNFPQDCVVIGNAHEFLKENYKDYDFIWSSPPCPSHSIIRKIAKDFKSGDRQNDPIYPNMELYEEILFLQGYFEGKWVVENVNSWYAPLIKPQKRQRHYLWSNFFIEPLELEKDDIHKGTIEKWEKKFGFDLSECNGGINKTKILRNCVHPELGKHILECAFKKETKQLEVFMNG